METNIETLKGRIKKLIGVEPEHLHHVLQAIDIKLSIYSDMSLNEARRNLITDVYVEGKLQNEKIKWNLTLPLSSQSEDTINFLLELTK